MPIRFEGEPIEPAVQHGLRRFADALAVHPNSGPVDGRFVQASPRPAGITATMAETLRLHMKPDEFAIWQAAQVGRTVATGGKTFVGHDGVVTTVIHPMPSMQQEFLDLGAHELTEMAKLLQEKRDAWVKPVDPDEHDGIVMFDEYRNERIRQEIRDRLAWPEGRLDASPGLVSMTDDIASRIPSRRLEFRRPNSGPPGRPWRRYGRWLRGGVRPAALRPTGSFRPGRSTGLSATRDGERWPRRWISSTASPT